MMRTFIVRDDFAMIEELDEIVFKEVLATVVYVALRNPLA
jgi:hypothetical protein